MPRYELSECRNTCECTICARRAKLDEFATVVLPGILATVGLGLIGIILAHIF